MDKKSFIKLCKEREKEGYLTAPRLMFDIYSGKDDIPDEYIDLFSYKMTASNDVKIYCGKLLYEDLQNTLKEIPEQFDSLKHIL